MIKPYIPNQEKSNLILRQIQIVLQAVVRLIAVNVSISNSRFTITVSPHGIEYFKHKKAESQSISWKEIPQNTRIELLSELTKELVILVKTKQTRKNQKKQDVKGSIEP